MCAFWLAKEVGGDWGDWLLRIEEDREKRRIFVKRVVILAGDGKREDETKTSNKARFFPWPRKVARTLGRLTKTTRGLKLYD